MKNYVEISYQETEKPFGKYPLQLAQYLTKKYELKVGMRLLDTGCGRGEFLHAFSQCGLNTSGTDLSTYCKDSIVVDLEKDKLPFEDEYFDVIFSKSVLEHINNSGFYLNEIKRVLKRDGLLILMVPDWKTQYKIFYQDPTHIHPYTKESIERLLLMMEFKQVKTEKFIQLPGTWNNPFIRFISKCLRIFGSVNKIYKNKFVRFSRELMILGVGRKGSI